jgi:hypothetical protein
VKTRKATNNKKAKRLIAEAEFYRAMALKKVGSKIKIPERRFIGWSPELEKACTDIIIEAWQAAGGKIADNIK